MVAQMQYVFDGRSENPRAALQKVLNDLFSYPQGAGLAD
jgi:hypothetical protein